MTAVQKLREGFREGRYQYKKENEICRLAGVSAKAERAALSSLLKELEEAGEVVRDERGRFVTPEKLGLVRGTAVSHLYTAPAGSPMAFSIRGAIIALRTQDCRRITVAVETAP